MSLLGPCVGKLTADNINIHQKQFDPVKKYKPAYARSNVNILVDDKNIAPPDEKNLFFANQTFSLHSIHHTT